MELLFFQDSVFQVDSNLLLLTTTNTNISRKAYFSVFFELARAEAFFFVKFTHHGSVRELALHEELGVLATLCSQLDLFLVDRLETSRQL